MGIWFALLGNNSYTYPYGPQDVYRTLSLMPALSIWQLLDEVEFCPVSWSEEGGEIEVRQAIVDCSVRRT